MQGLQDLDHDVGDFPSERDLDSNFGSPTLEIVDN